jgi:hypothetical protein
LKDLTPGIVSQINKEIKDATAIINEFKAAYEWFKAYRIAPCKAQRLV